MGFSIETSASNSKSYAADGALDEDIDCLAEGPVGQHAEGAGRVRVGVGGTLHVVYADDTEDTITYASGDVDDIRVKTIKADSTAQKITVYWFARRA